MRIPIGLRRNILPFSMSRTTPPSGESTLRSRSSKPAITPASRHRPIGASVPSNLPDDAAGFQRNQEIFAKAKWSEKSGEAMVFGQVTLSAWSEKAFAFVKFGMRRHSCVFLARTQATSDQRYLAEDFDVAGIAKAQDLRQGLRAAVNHQRAILETARGAESPAVPDFEHVERLCPSGRRQRTDRYGAPAVDREKHRSFQVRMEKVGGEARPKQISERRRGGAQQKGQSLSQEERHLFEFRFDCAQKWRRMVVAGRRLAVRFLPVMRGHGVLARIVQRTSPAIHQILDRHAVHSAQRDEFVDAPRGKIGGFEVGQRARRAEVVRIPKRTRNLRGAFGYLAKG